MSFFDVATHKSGKPTFKKVEFLSLPIGQTTIRVLSKRDEVFHTDSHYVKGVSIKCLGEDCPICENNRRIIVENPESFRSIQGYSPKSYRFAVNVLDKSPVKICPSCGAEVKKIQNSFPAVCPDCNRPIVSVQETVLNKVKVLSKGKTLAEQLNAINDSILDQNGTPIGINNYDIVLLVSGSGREQTITPIPLPDKNDVTSVPSENLFDLSKSVVTLTVDEIMDLQKGISLRDIFAARRASNISENLTDEVKDVSAAITDKINKIFGN